MTKYTFLLLLIFISVFVPVVGSVTSAYEINESLSRLFSNPNDTNTNTSPGINKLIDLEDFSTNDISGFFKTLAVFVLNIFLVVVKTISDIAKALLSVLQR